MSGLLIGTLSCVIYWCLHRLLSMLSSTTEASFSISCSVYVFCLSLLLAAGRPESSCQNHGKVGQTFSRINDLLPRAFQA